MNCLIVEDQPPAQRILKKYITDYGSLDLRATYPDALQAADHLRRESIDLMFLDINLPKLSGLDFLKSLPHPPAVILTTAYSEFALEGYELDVVDYLLKPFSFQRFVKAVNKVPTQRPAAPTAEHPVDIFIKSGHEHVRINLQEVLYLQAGADYTELVTAQKKHLSTDSLRAWLDRLDGQQFLQVHKSFVVNLHHVERVIGNEIFLPDHLTIPIGRTYKDDFLERLVR
ncbi:DNA-binding LytR/AlgR family response regulator [Lewinella marina]|uniref:DNA-binding response regulator n=1 Tax=Neolewinella marina TaxID=438751 RepID=A0A2G0CHC3_9BACT|nr:LytTR family DNA-binding domain-containing protein [Neolewinella marina]NJB86148.1 DNA-binding LytR/AlgR family response regulator [Neolewinella marina]PHK99374.1 DNA-binding response regulator [Neolewinella marina]